MQKVKCIQKMGRKKFNRQVERQAKKGLYLKTSCKLETVALYVIFRKIASSQRKHLINK